MVSLVRPFYERNIEQHLISIALGVHILLSINRPDIAQKEYAAARAWADDSLLIQVRRPWLAGILAHIFQF